MSGFQCGDEIEILKGMGLDKTSVEGGD